MRKKWMEWMWKTEGHYYHHSSHSFLPPPTSILFSSLPSFTLYSFLPLSLILFRIEQQLHQKDGCNRTFLFSPMKWNWNLLMKVTEEEESQEKDKTNRNEVKRGKVCKNEREREREVSTLVNVTSKCPFDLFLYIRSLHDFCPRQQ